jgi:site-specific DNA recombinase
LHPSLGNVARRRGEAFPTVGGTAGLARLCCRAAAEFPCGDRLTIHGIGTTGQIAHKGQLYSGRHPALIDTETWIAVHDQLVANDGDHRHKARAVEPSLLAGLLVDARGERLTPSHAVKKGRRYRYYVSAPLTTTAAGADRAKGWRLPAREIEGAVVSILVEALSSPAMHALSSANNCPE